MHAAETRTQYADRRHLAFIAQFTRMRRAAPREMIFLNRLMEAALRALLVTSRNMSDKNEMKTIV